MYSPYDKYFSNKNLSCHCELSIKSCKQSFLLIILASLCCNSSMQYLKYVAKQVIYASPMGKYCYFSSTNPLKMWTKLSLLKYTRYRMTYLHISRHKKYEKCLFLIWKMIWLYYLLPPSYYYIFYRHYQAFHTICYILMVPQGRNGIT